MPKFSGNPGHSISKLYNILVHVKLNSHISVKTVIYWLEFIISKSVLDRTQKSCDTKLVTLILGYTCVQDLRPSFLEKDWPLGYTSMTF